MKEDLTFMYQENGNLYCLFENYEEDIEELGMEDLLVRFCGFYKISSQTPKTITTSCVDYNK